MQGALSKIRILDTSTVIAGPFAAGLLADFGAEVIKVEMPGVGDSGRNMGPFYEGKSIRWATFGRNKKSITLDLRKHEGRDIFLKLAAKSDIIIENFRTGTFDKWGYTYEALKAVNPGIIVVRITGYGQTGPNAQLAGFGTPCTAFSGLTHLSGFPDRAPVSPPIALADYVAGLYGALAALTCIISRDAGNGGQEADVSLYEGLFRMLEGTLAEYDKTRAVKVRHPGIKGSASPSGTFRTRDDKWVVLVCSTDRTFSHFARAIGRPDLLTDERFHTNSARIRNNAAVEELVQGYTTRHTYAQLKAVMDAAGVPVSLVYSMEDIFADPHYAARKNLVEVEHPDFGTLKVPSVTPVLSKTPGEIKWIGPALGQHVDEVFKGLLGMSDADIVRLREAGAI